MSTKTSSPLVGALALAALLVALPATATVLRVPADYPTVQGAIDAAVNGDIVKVWPGRYAENIDFKGKRIVVRGTQPTDPDVVKATILDGNLAASVVRFATGETNQSILMGFTITRGQAQSGGGILVSAGCSPNIHHNLIVGNAAAVKGGGVFSTGSPNLNHNLIRYNQAPRGGGVCVEGNSTQVTYNVMYGNQATEGAGLFSNGTGVMIAGNVVTDNTATTGPGGLMLDSGKPTVARNVITKNKSTSGPGGLYCTNAADLSIVNNTIASNTSVTGVAGVHCNAGGVVFRNNIVAYNLPGALQLSGGAVAVIRYSCFFSNGTTPFLGLLSPVGLRGNIAANPRFVSATNNDYHLRSQGGRYNARARTWVIDGITSPCIDAGDPAMPFALEPAPNGSRINMGAYGNTRQASKSPEAPPPAPLTMQAMAAPIAGGVSLALTLSAPASVQVAVMNVAGRPVASLPPRDLPTGLSTLTWNGHSSLGTTAPAGTYLLQISAAAADGRLVRVVQSVTIR